MMKCSEGSRIIVLTGLIGIAVSSIYLVEVDALTLDDAVSAQLENGCPNLAPVAGGNLDTAICSNTTGGSSNASGGGAVTPVSLPLAVADRLEKERGEQGLEIEEAEVQLGHNLSIYLSAQYEVLDRDRTTFEDGYDSDIWQLTIGTDSRISKQVVVGVALSASRQEGDFDRGGDFDVDAYKVVFYSLYQPGDDMFIQASAGYGMQSHDRRRQATFSQGAAVNVSGKASSDYDADQYDIQLLGGYNFTRNQYVFGPRLGLDWTQTDYDDYSESGGGGLDLRSHSDDVSSLQSSLGVWASMATNTSFGVLTTQSSLSWRHEFDRDQRDIDVSFVEDQDAFLFSYETEDPDRNFFEYSLSFAFVLPDGVQTFISYRTLFGHDYLDNHIGTLGLRIEL